MPNSDQKLYPVRLEVDYPGKSSRLLALFGIPWLFIKTILLIPHMIVIGILNVAAMVAAWFSFWAILFTGKYPRVFFDFIVGEMRWRNRVNAWLLSLTDKYPPFRLH